MKPACFVLTVALVSTLLSASGCYIVPTAVNAPTKRLKIQSTVQADNPQPKPTTQALTLSNGHVLEARVLPKTSAQLFGGQLQLAEIGEGPKTFNPWAAMDATSSQVADMFSAGLVSTDPDTGEVVPYLAKRVEVSPDHCQYTLTLRRGLQWSDGHGFSSADVLFTWNTILKQGLGNASTRDSVLIDGVFPTVWASDAYTVHFKTPKPFAPFLRSLGTPIAPAHVLAPIIRKGGDAAFTAAWSADTAVKHPEALVGMGLWQCQRYDRPNQMLVFKRNPYSFVYNAQYRRLPYLQHVVTRFVKDMNTMQLLYEQGAIDVYDVPGQFLARVLEKSRLPFLVFNLGPASGTTFLAFNLAPQALKKTPFFASQAFRQAIGWAVNREALVQNILLGIGEPLYGPETPASVVYNPAVEAPYLNKTAAQRLATAKALLQQAGFYWKNGQLYDAQHRPVCFTILTNAGNDQREQTVVSVQQDLAMLGIEVSVKPVAFNVLVGQINSGQFETVVLGLTGSTLEPHGGLNVWTSHGALHLFNQRNAQNQSPLLPWERALDDIFAQGALTFNPAKRLALYQRYQTIVASQQPFVYLYTPTRIVAVHRRLHGIRPTVLGGALHNLESLSVNRQF